MFGTRAIFSNEPGPPVRTVCPRCRQGTDLSPRSYRRWFTLFFIPVFPVSGRTQFMQCPQCGGQFTISPEALRQQSAANDQQQSQETIRLYNSLRASPGNSITLNDLMQRHASMKDFDEAIAVAGQFPEALNRSEQCQTTLGRVYLAQDRHAEALAWFDAAIATNALYADGHYYKALTHLLSTPSDPQRAVSAARAARTAGHPNAEALLRDAEAKARQ